MSHKVVCLQNRLYNSCISPAHAVVLKHSGNVALGIYCDVMSLSI